MIILPVIFFSSLTVLLGRWAFGRWFNHVGIYGATWGFTLSLFHSGLIEYYSLESETWILIISAWLAFLFGSFTIIAGKFALAVQPKTLLSPNSKQIYFINESDLLPVYKSLWMLNIILIVHTLYEVYNVVRLLGGDVTNVLALANMLYDIRVKEGIPGSIPYFGQLVFFAAILSGIYTSATGKLKFIAFIPFLIAITTSFIQVVRALALIVAILFICAYLLNNKRVRNVSTSIFSQSIKRFAAVIFLIALLVLTIEVVRSTRGIYEKFSGQSSVLKDLRKSESSFLSPSVVMYLSVHSGVLNQYLKEDVEQVVWGRYTFAPFWRIISKLGFDTYVGFYQSWFYNTPVAANTGTYIRELHADFGVGGVIIVPYFLGFICSFYWFRVAERNNICDIAILTHIYSVVAMSWFVMLTQLGGWVLSLIVGVVITRNVDRKINRKRI